MSEQRTITVVSACMTSQGLPTFSINQVDVTDEEMADGIHYYLVEAMLLEKGLEEPFVHFDESEAPAFLIPAVRESLCSDLVEVS